MVPVPDLRQEDVPTAGTENSTAKSVASELEFSLLISETAVLWIVMRPGVCAADLPSSTAMTGGTVDNNDERLPQ